jgi:Mg-chelatase subunit ChlD
VRTLISVLEPQDRLCLVAYSNTAQVIFGLTPMEPAAKARLMKQVDELDADGNTNLWDGLHTGLEQLRNAPRERLVANEGRLSALLLLTDGLPNVHPPRGEIAMLQRYRDQHGLNCTIHTFGV